MHLLLIAGRNRRHRPAVKGVLKGDDLKAVTALALVIGTGGFNSALHRLSAGIGKEYRIGKGGIHKPLGKGFPLRAAIEVRHMDQRCRLVLNRFGQMRMTMAKQVHSDARCEVQRAAAVFGNQPSAFTSDRPKTAARIDWHQGRNRHGFLPSD